jgi:Carbohydrate family 9 binding domain-like
MTLLKRLSCIDCLALLGLLIGLSVGAFGSGETRIPGKQLMVARFTTKPPTIDGVFSVGEWKAANSIHVDGSTPATAPGVVPNLPDLPVLVPPDSPADSSFTIYTLYDNDNLYVAVDVIDDFVFSDGPLPFLDDDVEVMIDGDRQPGDAWFAIICGEFDPFCPIPVVNKEGFKLTTSVGNEILTDPGNNPKIVWESKAGLRPHGFVIEFRIPLDSINTRDTSWFSGHFPPEPIFRRPQPGDIIGFNVLVGDDDNGGLGYLREKPAAHTDSATAWDGRFVGWFVFSEADWGNLL